ncbi:MAG: pyridoxamine 5'-phosphate oxidase [Segetibacter sp.]|nr:pyridoxamine 5'-phosphate oxidase [Segetibacter sp.]
MNEAIASIRKDYRLKSLLEADVKKDPVEQFSCWWDEAVKSDVAEVNAMTLATCSVAGRPSARIVLLKGFTNEGFVFFTNYQSHKGKELESNPCAALVFFWKELERQVRIEGAVEKISEAQSDSYFQSRPTGSKIGAWASAQSSAVANREVIEESYLNYSKKFNANLIPRPSYWGGYIVKPEKIEFWQGRSSRLHDRILYSKQNEEWKIERLSP